MNTQSPLVSVILPVHNGEAYIAAAIQSILDQTYANFELLLLISGTTNQASLDVINSFTDPRIRQVLRTPEDAALPQALNRGMREARGKYLARMDADDISLPHRFARQVAYMEAHPEIALVGSWAKAFGAKHHVMKHPAEPQELKAHMLFNTGFIHPTVMMRREMMEKNNLQYNPEYICREDMDLWARSGEKVLLSNIPEVLLLYRMHDQQATHRNLEQQKVVAREVRTRQLAHLGIVPTERELELHAMIKGFRTDGTLEGLHEIQAWLEKISSANREKKVYIPEVLAKVLGEKWFISCYVTAGTLGMAAWKTFWYSTLASGFAKNPRNIIRLIKFVTKTLGANLRLGHTKP